VCFVVCKTTSELEHVILTTLCLTGAKNTDSWCAMKGDLQCAFPLYVLMAQSSALAVSIDCERLMCGGLALGETIHFGSLEFIADCFGGLSLSPKGSDPGAVSVGTTHSGSPSLLAMMEDSTEEFYSASNGERGL
jgi:hypothetical protein